MRTEPQAQSADAGPAQQTVATYTDYREAERAVDHLADSRFPVEHVSIVGRDLRYVERVLRRATIGWAAGRGALTGAVTGGLIGWLFALVDWYEPIIGDFWLIVDGLWFGAVVGLGMGLLMYALMAGHHEFVSAPTTQAERYDILVDAPYAEEAQRVLGTLGAATSGSDARHSPVPTT